MSEAPKQPVVTQATDEEIDAIVAEFGGDPRLAIRALLHDLTELAMDSEAAVSRGFVRGRLLPFKLADACRAEKP
jgi:ATP-dependent exoDNAse (exonuclease V) alpha subunit